MGRFWWREKRLGGEEAGARGRFGVASEMLKCARPRSRRETFNTRREFKWQARSLKPTWSVRTCLKTAPVSFSFSLSLIHFQESPHDAKGIFLLPQSTQTKSAQTDMYCLEPQSWPPHDLPTTTRFRSRQQVECFQVIQGAWLNTNRPTGGCAENPRAKFVFVLLGHLQ